LTESKKMVTYKMEPQPQLVEESTYQMAKQIGYEFKKPTQDSLQTYIRREFNLHIEISGDSHVEDSFYYAVSVLGGGYITKILDPTNYFRSYEKAREAGLVKAMKWIKEKKAVVN
jgi:hypothetical protein